MKAPLFLRGLTMLVLTTILCAAPASATSFSVLLGGQDATKGCNEIEIDDLNIDEREMTTGLDVEYRIAAALGWRLYGPGAAHWGNARFTLDPKAPSAFRDWFETVRQGKVERRSITITFFNDNNEAIRNYNLFDCFPKQTSLEEFDTSSTVQTETLTVDIGGITIEALSSRKDSPGAGPVLVNLGRQATGLRMVSWAGGEPRLHLDALLGDPKFRTNSPGHKTVNEITLRGAMTDGRKNLCTWINDTVNGKPWKQDLTITEMLSVDGAVKPGKTYTYMDCFPIRYVFPRMSVTNTTGNTMEEISFKPIRLELK